MKNIKETVERALIALMVVVAITIALVLPTMAAEEGPELIDDIEASEKLDYLFGGYEVIDLDCEGYTVIADPYIMYNRQNRRFKDNNDFMIYVEKDGDIYTGSDVKIKVVAKDNEGVYVRIVRVKGIHESKKEFKDSKLIKFWDASQVISISPIERKPKKFIPIKDETQSENSKQDTEFILFTDEGDKAKR